MYFCKFTEHFLGIQQYQVDNGVPLITCMCLFQKWLSKLVEKYNISFETTNENCKQCIFATWSDWDLGMCLKKECKRKRIPKDAIFNKWIDVRSLYVVSNSIIFW